MGKVLEVLDTTNAFVNEPKDDDGNQLPLGAVKVRSAGGGGKRNFKDEWAIPLGPIKRIPLVGEHVITLRGPSWGAGQGDNPQRAYYLTSCNIQDNLNVGILPQTFLRGRNNPIGFLKEFLNSLGNPQKEDQIDPFLGETFQEIQTVKPVQPYEGDTIIESRFGQCIRFGSSVTNSPHPDAEKGIDLYEIKACADWLGGELPSSPILFITNGLAPVGGKSRYTKESFEDDKGTICMTSGQQLKTFETAQSNLGNGVDKANKSETSQVIINSDRLVFNAKKEHVILSAKQDVIVATPDWAAEMNEVLSIMDEFLKVMERITSGASPYPTAPGFFNAPTVSNPATGDISALVARMEKLKQ